MRIQADDFRGASLSMLGTPDRGIVRTRVEGVNQKDAPVLSMTVVNFCSAVHVPEREARYGCLHPRSGDTHWPNTRNTGIRSAYVLVVAIFINRVLVSSEEPPTMDAFLAPSAEIPVKEQKTHRAVL